MSDDAKKSGSNADKDIAEARPIPLKDNEGSDAFADSGSADAIVKEPVSGQSNSLYGRTAFIAVIFLCLGGIVSLWAGPRIAPHLPTGMAPLAAWLSPGIPAELDKIRAEFIAREALMDARIAALEARPGVESLSETLDTRSAAFTLQLEALSDQVAAADSGSIEARIAAAETRISGLQAELESLLDRESAGTLPSETGMLSPDISEALMARIVELEAEVIDLAARQGALSQQIDEVGATADRKVEQASQRVASVSENAALEVTYATLQAQLNALEAALQDGRSYSEPLAALGRAVSLPQALSATAATGVVTQAELEEQFPSLAHAAIRADIIANADEGFLARANAELRARTTGRLMVETEGPETDAVLSRLQARLQQGLLAEALAEAETLSAAARVPLAPWLERLSLRANALEGFSDIAAQLVVISGGD